MADFADVVFAFEDDPLAIRIFPDDVTAMRPAPIVVPPIVEQDTGPVATASPPPVGIPLDFREHARAISPGFLRGPRAERFMGVLGLLFDTLCQGALTAVFQRNMVSPAFTPTSIALLGAERMLPRLPGESAYGHFVRVHNAWRIWARAGSEVGLVEQLEEMQLSAYVLGPGELNYDGDPSDWSRVFVVVSSPRFESEGKWGDGRVWGDGGTWGSTASLAEVDAVRRTVRAMKPGERRVEHVLVQLADVGSVVASGSISLSHDASVDGPGTFANVGTVLIGDEQHAFQQVSSPEYITPTQTQLSIVALENVDPSYARANATYVPVSIPSLSSELYDESALSHGITVSTLGGGSPADDADGTWDAPERRPTNYAFWDG